MTDALLSDEIAGFAADSPETGGRTLVEGATFVVCGPGGDISGEGAEGLFVRNARALSRWRLRVDGQPLEPLAGFTEQPFCGRFVARAPRRAGTVEPTLVVERRRYVGAGMREDIILHNHGPEAAGLSLSLELGCDLADLFEVKLGRPRSGREVNVEAGPQTWTARGRHGTGERTVIVTAPGAAVSTDALIWRTVVEPHGTWRTSVEVTIEVDRTTLSPRFTLDAPVERAAPAEGMSEWRRESPCLRVDSPSLSAAFYRSETDLSALRVSDPSAPDLPAVAAGAPWFMALFGRDSLITSWMTLPVNRQLAVGTLAALARYQGRSVDPLTEEEPGRILHELRLGVDSALALGGAERYYGSVDATPLFVVVLAELARWGAPAEVIDGLLPAADRALDWIARFGDRDGDGLVEYQRSTDRGLRNQGWKDSLDGINFADGTVAEPPIALVEVQAYVYAAYKGRSYLAARQGDRQAARYWSEQARTMKKRIDQRFWLPDQGFYAVGLDRDKRPIDSLTSNVGHVLWAGAAQADKAAVIAERLLSPEMFSGYGIRTLATTMGAYNPVSYHNGSVWPHDNALAVAGLVRYGLRRHAQRIAAGLIDAAAYFSGRLPELFCGFDKEDYQGPVPYPNACSPQAWAAATPIALVRAMLGLEPDVPAGRLSVVPAIPPEWGRLQLSGIPIGEEHLDVEVRPDGTWEARGLSTTKVAPG